MATTTAPFKAKLSKVSDRELRVERIFNAPRDRVWKAMTDPVLLAQWWGRGNKLVVEKHELWKGGHWRVVEHADGQTHGFEGRFAEIVAPTKIVQTFEWDGMPGHSSLDTMELEDLGDGRTKLKIHSTFMLAEDLAGMMGSGMETGMNASYDALDRVLAAME